MSLNEGALLEDVRARLFAASSSARTIGAELELIPLFSENHAPVFITDEGGRDSTTVIRRAAQRDGWRESATAGSPPSWEIPGGGRISFEPGGQIEISSPPHGSCSELITDLQRTVNALGDSAAEDGIDLVALGTDPFNDIGKVPLQLTADRYARMTRYFKARGEFGIRMMRQTAAIQISVEHGEHPVVRWALLNSLAPYMVAIFANSPRYGGRDTGHASYRAHFWRMLDDTRTGIPFDASEPAAAYTRFALGAGALRAEAGRGEFHPFGSLLHDSTLEDWSFHLSTLFPEVRPKEYFEIRSADTIAACDLAAPLVFVAGLVYDERAARDALDMLERPDADLLPVAGRDGLANGRIRARAKDLVGIAIEGAARLPDSYLTAAHKAEAAMWLSNRVR